MSLEASFKEAAVCLEEDGDSLWLKEEHAYYYQVQLQMEYVMLIL